MLLRTGLFCFLTVSQIELRAFQLPFFFFFFFTSQLLEDIFISFFLFFLGDIFEGYKGNVKGSGWWLKESENFKKSPRADYEDLWGLEFNCNWHGECHNQIEHWKAWSLDYVGREWGGRDTWEDAGTMRQEVAVVFTRAMAETWG